jgi:RHS repeat-associated protein
VAGSVGFAYNSDFRVSAVSLNGSDPVPYQYGSDGLLIQAGSLTLNRSAANGLLTGTGVGVVTDSHTYNGFGEAASYEATVNGASLFKTDYAYDKLGRIVGRTETLGSTVSSYAYGYDEAGRLTEVQFNGEPLSSYSYDANGNRLSYHEGVETTEGAYDDQDRLLTYGSASYSYSPNGELASKTVGTAVTTYAYDALGNLRRVVLPNGRTIDYVVDAANRRIGKKVDGVLVQGFLYQDQLKPVAELDGSGAIVSRFVYATRSNVPDYMVRDGVVYRIITDHLGSPRFVVNTSDGSIAQQMDYDAFGTVVLDTNPGFQPFGFAGGLYDRDTGLVRLGARDYDPHTGRWTAKDPILFAGGDTNLYGYVQNDPVNLVDPQGLADKWYGYDDKNFQDWAHQQKQDMGLPGNQNYTKEQLNDLYDQWLQEGRPRGKGGKSGKGGQTRRPCEGGPKLRAFGLGMLPYLQIGIDAYDAETRAEEYGLNPYEVMILDMYGIDIDVYIKGETL